MCLWLHFQVKDVTRLLVWSLFRNVPDIGHNGFMKCILTFGARGMNIDSVPG